MCIPLQRTADLLQTILRKLAEHRADELHRRLLRAPAGAHQCHA